MPGDQAARRSDDDDDSVVRPPLAICLLSIPQFCLPRHGSLQRKYMICDLLQGKFIRLPIYCLRQYLCRPLICDPLIQP